jgi:hypothetical protein
VFSLAGEGTIGSRYHSGRVSVFPSYKFTSTTWSLVKYHFRSLDTWLDGVCKSHCDEHPWHSDALNYLEAAGKRSIFCDACEDQDCSAGGEDVEQGGAVAEARSEESAAQHQQEQHEQHEEERGAEGEDSALAPVAATASVEAPLQGRHLFVGNLPCVPCV